MHVTVTPVLSDLRAIYDLEGVWPRYHAYVKLMTGGRGAFLPLGAFSPMGKRQPAFLDALLALEAEDVAQAAAREAAAELESVAAVYRLLLVVVDEPRNGWTQRFLTDAEWRFGDPDALPKSAPSVGFDRWVTVQLWTDRAPTAAYVRGEVRSSLYRAAHQGVFSAPRTLGQMQTQEGRAARFAGAQVRLDTDELAYTREVLSPLLGSAHFPTCFAALYGDEAARAVGYGPLGLSVGAGFELGLAEAYAQEAPDRLLRTPGNRK